MELLLNIQEAQEVLTVAVGGTLVIFFVISPIIGGVIARRLGRAYATTIITCSMMLVFSVTFVGLHQILPSLSQLEPQSPIIFGASLLASLTLALAVALLLRWHFTESPISLLQQQQDQLTDELPFERKRREWMARRAKSQHRE